MLDLPWASLLGKGGPWGLVMLSIGLILAGRLVPSSTVALLLKRGDDYKAAWEASEEARKVQAAQLAELMAAARTVVALPALPGVGERESA